MTDATPPRLSRPRFHLWRETDDPEAPAYLGVVTITNADQLLAETQAKGLGIRPKDSPFHLTALWVWAAAIRSLSVTDKFKPFTESYAWEGIKEAADDQEDDDAEDPTFGVQEASSA